MAPPPVRQRPDPSLSLAARRIREMVRGGADLFFTTHAQEEMRKDRLTYVDIVQALTSGRVLRRELRAGEWRCAMEGRSDGTRLVVVVVIEEEGHRLKVITVWKAK